MEMADYEKLVKELNHKLSEKDKQMEEHEMHIQTQKEREQRLNEEIESLKLLVDQTEDKASRMKQLLVKTKKDLADAKQKEAAQMISQSALRGDLEAHQQQLEELKIQCSELTAERHRLQEQLKLMNEQHQRTSSSYQLSLSALQDECTAAKADLATTVSEFESYKVRVHNVLKQQKHKSSAQSDGDAFKQEREHMEAMVEQLRSRLQETQQSLQSSTSELQQLQVEHDMLLERHNKILQETVSKEAELRERYRHAHLNMPSYCLRLTRVELCNYKAQENLDGIHLI
ncbi:GRIP and coiled-coil domain-containing 2 [Labeo rohita]|uniref:GRIP and coiled-coil domain-containing 2 n=1 Tax=Labeo rohita TaxID=84645 RepID=A0A498M892_LABRO|nr:GRIP and coiled-coil domain-containing 2 [Labeo rohita]